MDDGTYLVTGAFGCIGAWVTRLLLLDGASVIAFDAGTAGHRLDAALVGVDTRRLTWASGDVTDSALVGATLAAHEVGHIIHLAALQVPSCHADPVLGARVNVVGHMTMLQAAREYTPGRPLVYASSVGAYAAPGSEHSLADSPSTFYGVYKRAGEQAASLYWRDFGVSSLGLRPHTVYGPGRDTGLTSEPTAAILAAAADEAFHMSFGGLIELQYVEDVAQSFIDASRSGFSGADVVDLAGHTVTMSEVVASIERVLPRSRGTITFDDIQLPFPTGLGGAPAPFPRVEDRSVEDGIRATIEHTRRVLAHATHQPTAL